jgi:spermidine/putrescine transport system substrate-binding protein
MSDSINRRQFVGRSAAAAGSLAFGANLLAACKGKDTPAMSAGPLRISNWPLYIDKQTIPDFQKATGITVQYSEDVNDNNEFFAKIEEPLKRGQTIDRDIVVLTDWMAGKMVRLGYTAPLDDTKFPNKANLIDAMLNVDFDPGRKYTVPWVSGMTGLGYNPKRTGREITSVNDIFDPKFKGKVTMLTEMRDTFGLVMLGQGKDPTKATLEDVKAAAAKIKQARVSGQIRSFTGNDYADDLAAGNIVIAFAWSGDMQGLAGDNPDLKWVAPSEGAMSFSDNMMIPKTSDRQDLAMAWINWCYDPAHSAQIVSGAPYISDVKGAGAELMKIDSTLAKSELVNPPPELQSRLHLFRTLSDEEDVEFNRIFQDAIGA